MSLDSVGIPSHSSAWFADTAGIVTDLLNALVRSSLADGWTDIVSDRRSGARRVTEGIGPYGV